MSLQRILGAVGAIMMGAAASAQSIQFEAPRASAASIRTSASADDAGGGHERVLASEVLAAIPADEREDARPRVELFIDDPAPAERAREVEELWLEGRADDAIAALRILESEANLAVSLSMYRARAGAAAAGAPGAASVIDSPETIGVAELERDPVTGTLMATMETAAGWEVHRSDDDGASWIGTYTWNGDVRDLATVINGDYLYVLYVPDLQPDLMRIRRLFLGTG